MLKPSLPATRLLLCFQLLLSRLQRLCSGLLLIIKWGQSYDDNSQVNSAQGSIPIQVCFSLPHPTGVTLKGEKGGNHASNYSSWHGNHWIIVAIHSATGPTSSCRYVKHFMLPCWLNSLIFPLTNNRSKDLKKSMGQDRSKPTDPIHSFVCILTFMVLSIWGFFSERNRCDSSNTSESLFKSILSEWQIIIIMYIIILTYTCLLKKSSE